MFDRREIMTRAWAAYRINKAKRVENYSFGSALRWSWSKAKKDAAKAAPKVSKFDGLNARMYSNKYYTMSRVSTNAERVVVKVAEDQVFETRYGFGLILDSNHVCWLKSWQVNRNCYGTEVLLNREYFKPIIASRAFENYMADEKNCGWESWVNAAKSQMNTEVRWAVGC